MEIDIEDVFWKDDLVSQPRVIEAGESVIPSGPGWGAEINEDVIRAYSPARPVKWTRYWRRHWFGRYQPFRLRPRGTAWGRGEG
jgi:hypothetical protein